MEFELHDIEAVEQNNNIEPPPEVPSGRKKQSVTLDEKRNNRTSQCNKCYQYVSPKTMKYTHDCEGFINKPKKPEIVEVEKVVEKVVEKIVDREPNEYEVASYVMKRENERRNQMIRLKEERYQRLISHAF